MEIQTLIKAVVEIGITPTLLLVFVIYFIKRDKVRDEQIREHDKNHEAQLQEKDKNARERENLLIAENSRREDIMRKESDKREKILREESDKRESHLMVMLDGFNKSMEKISQAMDGMKSLYIKSEKKIEDIGIKVDNIETKIENMEKGGAG